MEKVVISLSKQCSKIADVEVIETFNGVNKVTKKSIWINDLIGILSSSLNSGNGLRLGKMPEGFYDGIIQTDGTGFDCLIVVPEGIKPFIYYDKVFNIPFPTLLFCISCKNGVLRETYLFALESNTVNDKTPLFIYPFGNVHANNRVCWGNNVIQEINSLRSVEKIISQFFGSSTNDDLWNCENKLSASAGKRFSMQRGLVEYLEEKNRFPKKLLLKTNMVVGKLLDGMELRVP